MSIGQALILGAVQGLTEFLPVSSSAHLFLVPTLLGWPYPGRDFDIALHAGTLLALLAVFGRDWLALFRDSVTSGVNGASARRTLTQVVVATIPAGIAGLLLRDAPGLEFRALGIQACTLVVFGFLLWIVDREAPVRPGAEHRWGPILVVGLAQALALVPGVSRSGVTITAGGATGMARVPAARLSFLRATPITFAALIGGTRHLSSEIPVSHLAAGVLSSAVVGLFAIHGLLRWLNRAGFGLFFAYRAALAAVLVVTLFMRPR